MVVRTRAKAKQQLEEELIRKEKELLYMSGAQPNTSVRVNEPAACDNVVPSRSESEADRAKRQSPMENSKLTKFQRREIRKKAQETEKSWEGGNSEYLDITIEDLKKLQAEDPTLAEVIRAADWSANDRNESRSVAEYYRREGLVYRRWTPMGRSSTFQVEQLVLPTRCRGTVLKLAHDAPSGGHLGREKTGRRLQSWESQQDCRCVVSCSKTVCCNRMRMMCDGCCHQGQFNFNTHARFDACNT